MMTTTAPNLALELAGLLKVTVKVVKVFCGAEVGLIVTLYSPLASAGRAFNNNAIGMRSKSSIASR
jgi:hypothetical protein